MFAQKRLFCSTLALDTLGPMEDPANPRCCPEAWTLTDPQVQEALAVLEDPADLVLARHAA